MQLLQLNDYSETPVLQCKVEIRRTVYHCGMWSHVSVVANGEGEYLQEVSSGTCADMHKTGVYIYGPSKVIRGLKVNSTATHSVTLADTIQHNGKCDGVGYSDPDGSWEDVIVQGTIKITLWQHVARVALDNNRVHLRSETVCPLSEGSCLDVEGGQTFWAPVPLDQCGFNRYGLLYEGYASRMTDHTFNDTQVVYSLSTHDLTFALTAKGRENVCGYGVIRTEHPKVVILETTKGDSFAKGS